MACIFKAMTNHFKNLTTNSFIYNQRIVQIKE